MYGWEIFSGQKTLVVKSRTSGSTAKNIPVKIKGQSFNLPVFKVKKITIEIPIAPSNEFFNRSISRFLKFLLSRKCFIPGVE